LPGTVLNCVHGMGQISISIQVKVQRWNASRSFNLLGMLAYLGLAVCVFTWGLQYKLSLYDPPQAASHQIPQAKILSRNELSGTTESPLVVRTKTSTRVSYTVPGTVFFILLLPLGILNPQESGQRELGTNRVRHLRRGLFDIFFLRPPPILA
jgi:hypothetical protein